MPSTDRYRTSSPSWRLPDPSQFLADQVIEGVIEKAIADHLNGLGAEFGLPPLSWIVSLRPDSRRTAFGGIERANDLPHTDEYVCEATMAWLNLLGLPATTNESDTGPLLVFTAAEPDHTSNSLDVSIWWIPRAPTVEEQAIIGPRD